MASKPENKTNIEHLETSDLLAEWVSQHLDGWDQAAWDDLLGQLRSAGHRSIDAKKIEQLVASLREHQLAPPRRTRGYKQATIAEIQTPLTQASAAWVDGEDFANRYAYQDGDFWMGRAENGTPLGHDNEDHILIVCKSRSGKGTGIILPNHLLWEGPLLSIDPKGENASVSAARRGDGDDFCIGMKQKVCVLDPLGNASVEEKYRCRFNPFEELDPSKPECVTKAARLADSLVVRTGRENEDFWKDSTRDALQQIILYIMTEPRFKKRRHLGTLRDLIIEGDVASWLAIPDDPKAKKPDALSLLFALMAQSTKYEIGGQGRYLLKMSKSSSNGQWLGVYGGMKSHTEWLTDPRVRTCVERSDFALSEIKSRPEGMSIYLCLPERDTATANRWQRIMINQIAYEMQGERTLAAGEKRLLMVLDEFDALDRMEEIARGMSHFASYGVKLVVVLQFLGQVKETYG